jgi:hypothetical protein
MSEMLRRARWAIPLLFAAALSVSVIFNPYLAVALLAGALVFILWAGAKTSYHFREIGYFEARTTMWVSISEAMDRGMSLDDWMEAESERDRMRLAGGPKRGLFFSPSEDPTE